MLMQMQVQKPPPVVDYSAQEDELQKERVRMLSAQVEEWKAIAQGTLKEMKTMAQVFQGGSDGLERELNQGYEQKYSVCM